MSKYLKKSKVQLIELSSILFLCFGEYSNQLSDLEELSLLLSEFDQHETVLVIKSVLEFYTNNQLRFEYLKSAQDDFDECYDQLYSDLKDIDKNGNFHIPMHKTIIALAEIIKKNPTEFYSFSNS